MDVNNWSLRNKCLTQNRNILVNILSVCAFLLECKLILLDGHEVNVGEYDSITGILNLTRREQRLWNGKSPPKDRTVRIIEHSTVDITLYAVLASAASVGIVLASIFLAINIRYRNQR